VQIGGVLSSVIVAPDCSFRWPLPAGSIARVAAARMAGEDRRDQRQRRMAGS
jgi:hypothetical protein